MKQSKLITDIIPEDHEDDLIKSIRREYTQNIGKLPQIYSHDDSSDDSNSYSTPTLTDLQPKSPTKNEDISPEKNYIVSIFLLVMSWASLVSGVVFLCAQNNLTNAAFVKVRKVIEKESLVGNTHGSKNDTTFAERASFQDRLYGGALHDISLENGNLPIFLDLPGTNTIEFTEALTKCLGLKGISANLYKKVRYYLKIIHLHSQTYEEKTR